MVLQLINDVDVTYSVERFSVNGTLQILEDGILADNITLTSFQGTDTYTHVVASDSVGQHTWKAVMDVTASGNVTPHAEDIDIVTVVVCDIPEEPPVVEVGGEVSPVNKLAILAPWIALAVVMIAGTTIAVRRRRTLS